MLSNPVLPSTFFLTLLLMVGLFFFIRASTKDRTETVALASRQSVEELHGKLAGYFIQRAYRPLSVTEPETDAMPSTVVLVGNVRPSWFLAVFLSFLAGTGCVCFSLVLATLFPSYGYWFGLLLLAAPGAGIYYWRRAGREEQVTYAVSQSQPSSSDEEGALSRLVLTAHRDEVIALRQALGPELKAI